MCDDKAVDNVSVIFASFVLLATVQPPHLARLELHIRRTWTLMCYVMGKALTRTTKYLQEIEDMFQLLLASVYGYYTA